ncbi:MAG: ArnT family glycosyltransferase [Microcoleaceae cyanobacterium]
MKSKSIRLWKLLHSIQASKFGWLLPLLWISWLSGIALFLQLGSTGLLDETEPLFAEAARQMLVTGDWITPYYNEVTRFDKPPLIYWLMVISYQIFGVNTWGVRLPSAIAAFGLTCLGFYTLWYYVQTQLQAQQKATAILTADQTSDLQNHQHDHANKNHLFHPLPWIGSALIALNPQMIAWGRVGVSDMLLVSCIGIALLAFFLGYLSFENSLGSDFLEIAILDKNTKIQTSSLWYLIFHLFIALAILTKGPVGFVLPMLVTGTFTLYMGNFHQVWREVRPVQGLGLILIITLPWYILVTLANGTAFLNTFFGYHNFQRFTQVVNHHSAPWYFYFIVVLLGCLPNSTYLPISLFQIRFWQRQSWQYQPRWHHLKIFAFIWFLCIFVFFTISVTKLPSYVLPLMPACAILIALFWSEMMLEPEAILGNSSSSNTVFMRLFFKGSLLLNIVFLLVLAFASFNTVNWLAYDPDMPAFPQRLQESGFLFRASLTWLLTAVTVAVLLWRQQISWILPINLLGFVICFIVAVVPIFNLLDQQRQAPLREIAQAVIQQKISNEPLVAVGFIKPSLVFYTKNPVQYYEYSTDAIAAFSSPSFQSSSQDTSSETFLLVAYPREFQNLGLQPEQYQILDQASVYQLVRVPRKAFSKRSF